ncbi:MAG: hypothetical protein FD187_1955 [bacterium]|nr:MAG: hypothetical protein FD187_1955 [bacterium]
MIHQLGGFRDIHVRFTVSQRPDRRAFLRPYRFISGVTDIPCNTMETATTVRVRAMISSAIGRGSPWLMAYIR